MSKDTIYRQAAIDALGDEPEVWTGKDEYAQGRNNQWHYDRNAIKAVPSAEPKRGEWEVYIISMIDGEGCRCSVCGFEGVPDWSYCPHCGSRMEG